LFAQNKKAALPEKAKQAPSGDAVSNLRTQIDVQGQVVRRLKASGAAKVSFSIYSMLI